MQNTNVNQQEHLPIVNTISLQPLDSYNAGAPLLPVFGAVTPPLNLVQSASLSSINSEPSLQPFTSNGSSTYTVSPLPITQFQFAPQFFAQNQFSLNQPFYPALTPSPRMTPSVSPGQAMYTTPSPLLLTPQLSSNNSLTSTPDFYDRMPMPQYSGSSNLFPPVQMGYTVSRTPERGPVVPNMSPFMQGPMCRERPMAPPLQPINFSNHYQAPLSPNNYFRNKSSSQDGVANGPTGKPQKKYGYRSKQRKIDRTHKQIQEKYTALGLFARERELVRGDDTLRIHVKTFEGLTDIQTALGEIDTSDEIEMKRIAAVFSKKNKFQKKGFIVYLKVGSVEQVEKTLELLRRFPKSLRNVAIARAKDKNASSKPEEHDLDSPPVVPRRLSATGM